MEARDAAGSDALPDVGSSNFVRVLLDAPDGAEVTRRDEDVHVIVELPCSRDVEVADVDVFEVEFG